MMFGLQKSGYQGQRLTDAVSWIHRRMGLETDEERVYNILNYCDDFAGVEKTAERAHQSATDMGNLLGDLGLEESVEKYHPPQTSMPYLEVLFDTVQMTMSIPPDRLQELREEVNQWKKIRR